MVEIKYETFSHQETILDKSLGISAGTVKIEGADKSTVFKSENGYTYIKVKVLKYIRNHQYQTVHSDIRESMYKG